MLTKTKTTTVRFVNVEFSRSHCEHTMPIKDFEIAHENWEKLRGTEVEIITNSYQSGDCWLCDSWSIVDSELTVMRSEIEEHDIDRIDLPRMAVCTSGPQTVKCCLCSFETVFISPEETVELMLKMSWHAFSIHGLHLHQTAFEFTHH